MEKGVIMDKRSFLWGIVATTVAVGTLSQWGVSVERTTAGPVIGIPPETVVSYIHDVIQADRTFYTREIVERMQTRGIVVASENWEQRGTLPLPAQFLNESARLVAENYKGVRFRLVSLWPI